MVNFLKYLYMTLMNKYGPFMWFGVHMGVTQINWHWLIEILLCILINLMVLHTIYLEWKNNGSKN
jgi:hypothetical protein